MSFVTKCITSYKDWTVRTIVQRTKTHCAINWLVLLILTSVIFVGEFLTVHDLLINDFLIASEDDVANRFAFDDAIVQAAESFGNSQNIGFRFEVSFILGTFVLYEVNDGQDFFTPENLKTICEIETIYETLPNYPLFCATDEANGFDTVCRPQGATVSSVFYTGNETTCDLLPQPLINAIKNVFFTQAPDLAIQMYNSLENPTIARATLTAGTPLGDDTPPFRNFSSATTDPFSEEAVVGHTNFQNDFVFSLFEYFGLEYNLPFENPWQRDAFTSPVPGATVQIRVYSVVVDQSHLDDVIEFDTYIIGGSFLFVLLFAWIYVKSFFLAFSAMVSVSLSMIVGLFLYAVVLQVDYFTTLHTASFFIILAVGANNFYVISDAWKQSKDILSFENDEKNLISIETKKLESTEIECEEEKLIARLDYAFTRASLSVFNTSMTTFIAFVANLISPISVIAGFGLFSGIAVLVNFFFMLNLHPTHLIFYYKYVKPLSCCCGRKHELKDGLSTQGDEMGVELEEDIDIIEKSEEKDTKIGFLEKFRNYYLYLILETYFPYAAFIFMAVLATVLVSFAARLQTPTTIEQLYPDSYMFTGFLEDFNNFEGGAETAFTEVFGVFGIASLDIADSQFLDRSQFRGNAVFDNDFDFSLQTTQDYIIEYCDLLPEVECIAEGCTIDKLVFEETISCVVKNFRTFYENEFNSSESFVTRQDGSSTGIDQLEFFGRVNQFLLTTEGAALSANVGSINGEVKFIAVSFRQTMREDQPYIIKEPVVKLINDFSATIQNEGPVGTNTFYHTSFDLVWQHTELGLVSGLFTGIAVSLGLSYLIVLFGTRNIVVSLFAISGVALIVGCVLGTVQTFGYELGVTEAIAGVMVIGLAVDYIVHLGYMFTAARKRKISYQNEEETEATEEKDIMNADMIRYSVEKMMFTILAGGLTTILAGLVLFACTLSFFTKMGVLILFTAVYSLMFAFLYFVPLLRICGPGKRKER